MMPALRSFIEYKFINHPRNVPSETLRQGGKNHEAQRFSRYKSCENVFSSENQNENFDNHWHRKSNSHNGDSNLGFSTT